MSDTPNHSYNTSEKGTEDWHGPLNENFENLEVDVELRDEGSPGSNSYEPADGAKYLDTVTGLVYIADGNTWNQVFDLTGGGGGSTNLWGVRASTRAVSVMATPSPWCGTTPPPSTRTATSTTSAGPPTSTWTDGSTS